MDILYAGLLSAVEGVTEFLPISSTGHLILTAQLLGIPQTEFVKSFEIIIQIGAIFAVLSIYLQKILAHKSLIPKILFAFVPTATIGFVLYKLIKQYLIGNANVVVATLFLGGIVLIFIEKFVIEKHGSIHELSYRNAFLIGLIQTIAIVPGVSRSAATIIGGMIFGLSRKEAVEFSFLLALPTLLAAPVLDLAKSGLTYSTDQFQVLSFGLVVSFVTAIISIKWLIKYVESHSFSAFGIYRIVLSLLFAFFFIA